MTDFRFPQQLALTVNNPSVRSIARTHADGRLQLRPPFQRNLVWNKEQKSYLIDSILRNFPIPEIYVQVADVPGRRLDDLMVIVDGQQRISSCIEFFTDKLRLVGEDLNPEWSGRIFSELSEPLQQRFARYRFVVRELPSLQTLQIQEIFTRLNRVVEPLTPQELRHAAYSGTAYLELIEIIASHPVLQEIRVFSAKDFRRRGNDELIAEIVHAHVQGAFPNKKEGLEEGFRYFADHGLPDGVDREVLQRFGRVYRLLENSSTGIRTSRFSNKSDFYSLMIYLLSRAESLPLPKDGIEFFVQRVQELSESIASFRRAEAAGEDIETKSAEDELVLKYMRAVQRAASDRLSRVRRNDVLEEWLGPALAMGHVTPLGGVDTEWVSELESVEEEAAAELEAERRHLSEVLLRDGSAGGPQSDEDDSSE